jgi:hypothetical protein
VSKTETVRLRRFWAKQNSACELTGTECLPKAESRTQKLEAGPIFAFDLPAFYFPNFYFSEKVPV